MNLIEITLLAISLSMDAFAVSICRGLALKHCRLKDMATVGFYFGLFQFIMPLLGYSIGMQFETFINAVDNIIPPVILGLIGANMVKSSLEKEENGEDTSEKVTNLPPMSTMLALAVATSIDAFAVGVTFIPLKVSAVPASFFIGCTTFTCSALGVKMGHLFGLKYKSKAEFVGGLVLILIGIKIFFQ